MTKILTKLDQAIEHSRGSHKYFLDHVRAQLCFEPKSYTPTSQIMVRQRLANLTKYINYGCNFTPEGKCKYSGNKECCCHECYSYSGYLRLSDGIGVTCEKINWPQLTYYTSRFKKTGFWREGKGCCLPRKYRSTTCLVHNCAREIPPWDNVVLKSLLHLNDRNDGLIYHVCDLLEKTIPQHKQRR